MYFESVRVYFYSFKDSSTIWLKGSFALSLETDMRSLPLSRVCVCVNAAFMMQNKKNRKTSCYMFIARFKLAQYTISVNTGF